MTQKTIVFDFGGVLFRTSASEFYKERFAEQGRSEEELQYFLTNIFTKAARSAANLGDARDVIEAAAKQHPQWAEDIRAFGADRDFIKQVRNVLPEMQEVLEELGAAGHRIVGLTNWAGDTFETLKEGYPDILKHFNEVVVSGKVHMKKPDPAIFRLAQQEFGNPDVTEVYYFDDKRGNIEAAQQAVGWKGFVFEGAATVRDALALRPRSL